MLALGYYEVLIGMDWLERHQVIVNFFQKTFTCLNDKEERIRVTRIPRKIYVRHLLALHMKNVVNNLLYT